MTAMVSGFSFFGGVPRSILYDNTRIAVARILGDGKRQGGHVCSASYDTHYLFEDRFGRPRQGERQGQGRGDRRLLPAGTSWCRCQGSGTSMISTRILKPAAPSDGRNNCVATTRRSANAWNGIVRFFSAFPQSPTTPATSARGGSVRCRWCAIAAPITPSPHGSAIARCWSAAMSTRWSSVAPQR